jgi:hypothetical protein
VLGTGVNFPTAVRGSGHNQPGLIAGFDPQQQLRRFSKQPTKVHSRDAQLAKLGGGDRRDFVFLDCEITGVGGHDEHSHRAFSVGFVALGKKTAREPPLKILAKVFRDLSLASMVTFG